MNNMQPTNEEIEQAKAIPLGIIREELIEILGEPDNIDGVKQEHRIHVPVYKYGAIHYHFRTHIDQLLRRIEYYDENKNYVTIKHTSK